ncbi:MAG: PadR family transcriptional regulator [Longimicrobiales bacterium]
MTSATERLSTPEFFILLVLTENDLHGSGIARGVEKKSQGEVRLWPVVLYRTLDELRAAGLIAELGPDRHPSGESRRRKYYGLTPSGSARLRREAERLAGLAAVALNAVNGVGSP